MNHIKLFENWLNENIWHYYVGDGVYKVGEHGINVADDREELEADMKKYEEDPEYEDDGCFDFDSGVNAIVYIKKLVTAVSDDLFSVYIMKQGDKLVSFQQTITQQDETYYGTDHSIFGSGNVSLLSKGSIEQYLKRTKYGL